MKYISSFLFILLVISGSLPAFSDETKEKTVIESIEYLGEKGTGELIQIELSKKVAPRVIKLPGASPRLVFDFVDSIKSKKIKNERGWSIYIKIQQLLFAEIHFWTIPISCKDLK